MRAPGEVMAENRPPATSLQVQNGSSSPLRLSPAPERKGINRAQLTLQELQSLAERQREQILYNSQELMEKQQQLMKMHHDYRARLKAQQEANKTAPKSPAAQPDNQASHVRLSVSPVMVHRAPRTPRSPKGKSAEQDQYAKILRATYQNMGMIQNKNQAQHTLDVKKFNNTELSHELEKLRAAFNAKQNELAEAVKKVDVLTHELEQRKNSENHPALPTPERINRRKKIQNAKDELFRLQNELIIRNEMNSQQSHQLQLQRDIIQEKKQELKQLNLRMNELGNALRRQHGGAFDPRRSLSYNKKSSGLFNGTYLHDTLSRRKHLHKHLSPSQQKQLQEQQNKQQERDVNSNIVPPMPPKADGDTGVTQQLKNGMVNGHSPVKPPQKPGVLEDTPVSGNQVWRNDPKKTLNFENNKTQSEKSPLHSPSSSISSLSSLSSASATPDEGAPPNRSVFPSGKEAPPQPPPRTTPIGVLIDHNEQNEEIIRLRAQSLRISELQEELRANTKVPLNSYNDSMLSGDKDDLKYGHYGDANSSCSKEELVKVKPIVKPKPPPISPKPSVAPKPKLEKTPVPAPPPVVVEDTTFAEKNEAQVINRHDIIVNDNVTITRENVIEEKQPDEPSSLAAWPPSGIDDERIIAEPDEFELSFADIDEINDMQTDIWSNSGSGSTASQSSYDSDNDSYVNEVVPVVISVPPEEMPPPILMKPDKPRRPKRNVVLDPFALLLDSALEGEMEVVKRTLMQVPDPSRPNPEGITALHNAVCGNHNNVVRYLVEVACDINSADNNGWTPLHCAAFYNDTELCRYLVENGASVFATTYTDYQTPAHKCSRLDDNYDECFAYLHECKENVGRIQGGLVHTLYDYTAENEDELSFYCGDELTILRRGDNNEKEWWWARDRKGNVGYIPCNLVGNFPRISAAV